MVYLPLSEKGSVVSWDQRVDGVSILDIMRVLSRFYDGLDPTSEFFSAP